jgi:hypothetical protein
MAKGKKYYSLLSLAFSLQHSCQGTEKPDQSRLLFYTIPLVIKSTLSLHKKNPPTSPFMKGGKRGICCL